MTQLFIFLKFYTTRSRVALIILSVTLLIPSSAGAVQTTVFPTRFYSETTHADGTVERTVSIEVAGMPIATIRTIGTGTPEVFDTYTDHLRSTRIATRDRGQATEEIVEQTDYDPFGKITNHEQSGDFSERHKFTSHEYDEGTSYTYAKARYLNTEIGRFISQDPAFVAIGDRRAIGEKTGRSLEQIFVDPQALNSYSYVKNNPIKNVDPTGEYIESALDVGFIISDIHAISTQGASFLNVISLIGDVGGLLLPGVTGVGAGVKVADKAIDTFKAVDKVADVGKATVKGADEAVEVIGDTTRSAGSPAPDFIVSEGGTVFPVPKGATGPRPVDSGKGFKYGGGSGGNGLHPDVNGFRMMDPKTTGRYQYPNGYGSYFNFNGKAVNPLTGKRLLDPANPWWHIPAQ